MGAADTDYSRTRESQAGREDERASRQGERGEGRDVTESGLGGGRAGGLGWAGRERREQGGRHGRQGRATATKKMGTEFAKRGRSQGFVCHTHAHNKLITHLWSLDG